MVVLIAMKADTPEMGKKGSGWFWSVKKVFKSSAKELPEKKVIPINFLKFLIALLISN